ncbi:MAG: glycoside hydrolase family 44 protein [bacterium]
MKRILTGLLLFLNASLLFAVDVTIDTSKDRTKISPYIYGVNQDIARDTNYTARRLGGNRMTGYNWENNASNAGSDWQQSSDNYLADWANVTGDQDKAGAVLTTFHDKSLTLNAYSIITLPLAGYVSKDKNGPVGVKEIAPSDRWAKVIFTKGKELSLEPDKNDGFVYVDEEVNFLVNKYGKADTSTGVKGYSLDNEPDIWSTTHPRLHQNKVGAQEYVQLSIDAASAVKKIDPSAEIYGPASYGFNGFRTFQDAPDYIKPYYVYGWYLAYYLEKLNEASKAKGMRLLDALDVHWYPEASTNGKRIVFTQAAGVAEETAEARVQAPRSLWDPNYIETSWICASGHCPIRLIPKLNEMIDKYYPGTKLAFTEYEYGAGYHPSGGIAEADVLGIFGKYGVYMANYWMAELGAYTLAGFRLYRNYDGNSGKYGDTNIKADTSDVAKITTYASIEGNDETNLHIIIINKDLINTTMVRIVIKSDQIYQTGKAYGFDKLSQAKITRRQDIDKIINNTFTLEMPALSAYHVILASSGVKKKIVKDNM